MAAQRLAKERAAGGLKQPDWVLVMFAMHDQLKQGIESVGRFEVVNHEPVLPLVAWRLNQGCSFSAKQLAGKLREKGWIIPVYTSPNAAQEMLMRVVIRDEFSQELVGILLGHINEAVEALEKDLQPAALSATPAMPRSHGIC